MPATTTSTATQMIRIPAGTQVTMDHYHTSHPLVADAYIRANLGGGRWTYRLNGRQYSCAEEDGLGFDHDGWFAANRPQN